MGTLGHRIAGSDQFCEEWARNASVVYRISQNPQGHISKKHRVLLLACGNSGPQTSPRTANGVVSRHRTGERLAGVEAKALRAWSDVEILLSLLSARCLWSIIRRFWWWVLIIAMSFLS